MIRCNICAVNLHFGFNVALSKHWYIMCTWGSCSQTICVQCTVTIGFQSGTSQRRKLQHAFPLVFIETIDLSQMSHAINPPCGKKGGHKNVRTSKTLRCVSQGRLSLKQNTGLPRRKLALWPGREVMCNWQRKPFLTTAREEQPLSQVCQELRFT